MVWIAGGAFTMGDGSQYSRAPGHVSVGGFCIDRTEVSVASYRACVNAGGCSAPNEWRDERGSARIFCNWGRAGAEDHPVNCVDHAQATAYCRAQGLRLPTEEEWEFAARGREGREWAWGSEGIDGTRANVCGDECTSNASANGIRGWPAFPGHHDDFPVTAPVDSVRAGATPEGLLHMTGNVSEWTSTVEGTRRVRRGGSWLSGGPSWVRPAARAIDEPAVRDFFLGFRCARGGM